MTTASSTSQSSASGWEKVLLVGTPTTVDAARSWHRTIWSIEDLARCDSGDRDEGIEAVERRVARSRFYKAARTPTSD